MRTRSVPPPPAPSLRPFLTRAGRGRLSPATPGRHFYFARQTTL
ncbi:hypothetical protein D516_3679 [Rhodobacter sp. AKP1]|nr:hypothetical protein D516_3679 [Rhodobacter sp. AKP1]